MITTSHDVGAYLRDLPRLEPAGVAMAPRRFVQP